MKLWSYEIRLKIGIDPNNDKGMREDRLRWFGHLQQGD